MGKAQRQLRRALNRAADAENAEWPDELVEIPVPAAMVERMANPPVRGLRSRRFLVQVYEDDAGAVEVYPPDAEIVDVARMRHLFLVAPERLPFAWRKG